MTHNTEHKELVDRCTRGDQQAQTRVYEMYYKAMYNSSLRILNDAHAAEDVMHEAFISAFSRIETYKGEVALGAWLKRITINKSINELKRQRRSLEVERESLDLSQSESQSESASGSGATAGLPYELTPAHVHRAIESLPDGYRIIVSLFLIEGYDHEEIAQILGISASTSRSQYARGRKKLQHVLTSKGQNGRV